MKEISVIIQLEHCYRLSSFQNAHFQYKPMQNNTFTVVLYDCKTWFFIWVDIIEKCSSTTET
jgi:hypothetical protein